MDYLRERLADGMQPCIGVGTGSTTNLFIQGLKDTGIQAAVSSSDESSQRLQQVGIAEIPLAEAGVLPLYIDGADEVDGDRNLIKGGGGALTREKLITSASEEFCCIVDEGKQVQRLGAFPLPVEVVPFAVGWIEQKLYQLGAERVQQREQPTDNGNPILDVTGLDFSNPRELEQTIEAWTGVVCCGVFARHRPQMVIVAGEKGIRLLK